MNDNDARRLLLTLLIPIRISGDEFLKRATAEGTLDKWDRAGLRWQFREVEQVDQTVLTVTGPPLSIARLAAEVEVYAEPCGCASCRAKRAGAEEEALLRSCGVPGWGRGAIEA